MRPFQNSLYSHLNRVHGVKKDMLQDMQLQMVQQQQNSAQTQVGYKYNIWLYVYVYMVRIDG